MKTIVVLSDTHGNMTDIRKTEGIMSESDYIIHLGDNYRDMDGYALKYRGKLFRVAGNCDFCSAEKEGILEVEGVKIFYTHGDRYGVKQGTDRILTHGREIGADVILYGHTHISEITECEGITLINPGNVTKYSTDKSICYIVVDNKKVVSTINRAIFES